MTKCPESSRTNEFAELKRQLDVADADIVLVNKRLDEAQGMYVLVSKFFKRSTMLVSMICVCGSTKHF